jgi:hypothetical protein
MAKSLFKNYSYEFDKNEAKIITTFCRQAIKQMMTDERFAKDVDAFQSVIKKVTTDPSKVKLVKDEKFRLTKQLEENIKYLKNKMNKTWFLPRWFYKSMLNQYNSLLIQHFRD